MAAGRQSSVDGVYDNVLPAGPALQLNFFLCQPYSSPFSHSLISKKLVPKFHLSLCLQRNQFAMGSVGSSCSPPFIKKENKDKSNIYKNTQFQKKATDKQAAPANEELVFGDLLIIWIGGCIF